MLTRALNQGRELVQMLSKTAECPTVDKTRPDTRRCRVPVERLPRKYPHSEIGTATGWLPSITLKREWPPSHCQFGAGYRQGSRISTSPCKHLSKQARWRSSFRPVHTK